MGALLPGTLAIIYTNTSITHMYWYLIKRNAQVQKSAKDTWQTLRSVLMLAKGLLLCLLLERMTMAILVAKIVNVCVFVKQAQKQMELALLQSTLAIIYINSSIIHID